ncbi:Aste57867_11045 [Aphanomyces stellatus]|uniref:Aste57867_11045 protein n=1 Tax=Aphanomyces stellatus TaxID=120398 RepID=A0A485KSC2_9STRA|nr:hypothetical protein As57867_011003 [Aphanomyces stellatus]VFT87913.1 Aste57867_11045 [Aphanomyces stellatus]
MVDVSTIPPQFQFPTQDLSKSTLAVTAPAKDAMWLRGQPAQVTWDPMNLDVADVRIVLLQTSSIANHTGAYTMVAECTANNGTFEYRKVPWGLCMDNDYFIRVMSLDGQHFVDGDCFSVGV